MFRALLLAAVVVAAASHGHHRRSYYGLDSYLSRSDVDAALRLVTGRYSGISNLCAAKIIKYTIDSPHSGFLRSIKLRVPSRKAQRLSYIRSFYRAFPSQIFYSNYIKSLTAALNAQRIRFAASQLVDSLALSDYFFSVNRVRPLSSLKFNQFYFSKLLGQYNSHGYTFPGYSIFLNRLSHYSFPGNYFSSLTAPSPIVSYTGFGNQLLPVFSSVKLVPSVPAVTLPSLYSYLQRQRIVVPTFIDQFSNSFNSLYRPVSYASVRRYGSHLGFINSRIFARDLQPLLALRYYSFPSTLRANIFQQNARVSFAPLLQSYFKQLFTGRLLSNYRSYDSGFVSAALDGFGNYCRSMSAGRYSGPYWAKSLFKYYKKG